MQISEIREKEISVLKEELSSLEQARFDVAMRSVTEEGEGQKLRAIKKDIARYKTVINERRKAD